ncbi:tyrosine-type recombinase/integrase [Spirillospora sp. NPDC048824]|uniref:tyrosine-type recombinase/integrase n=1 Tax=Spirillospora sp. NPDC048824 TaxID=3364526 RepID=UPI0037215F84
MHPHMLRHTFVTIMLDAGVDLCDVQIAARHAERGPPCATTEPATISPATLRLVTSPSPAAEPIPT